MKRELERAGRALVALATAASVSWWLWPPGAGERRPLQPEARAISIPIIPIAPPPPAPAPPPPPPLIEATARPAIAPRPEARPAVRAAAPAARELPIEPASPPGKLPEGRMPELRGSYVRIGFADYRDAMLALGAGFFLFDAAARQTLAEIDPLTGAIRAERVRPELSLFPRDVTRHLEAALEIGRKRYGARASSVVLLPPVSLDAALLAALARELPPLGVALDEVVRVDLVYELREGRLECEVVGVGLREAGDRALALRVTLSDRIPGLSYLTSREEMQHA